MARFVPVVDSKDQMSLFYDEALSFVEAHTDLALDKTYYTFLLAIWKKKNKNGRHFEVYLNFTFFSILLFQMQF